MTSKIKVSLAALLACACLSFAAVAWATQTLTFRAAFTPDKLGSPTNLSVKGTFHSTTAAAPSPISKLTAYLPAGMTIDVRGTGTCTAVTLEAAGPSACPADSRAGFGAGVALLELAKEIIHESYTLDFFFAPREGGHIVILAYVYGASPASVELVLVAKEIQAPSPYGIGFSLDVPPIPTLPGASNASVEKAFFTVGATNVAYYQKIHGKRTLIHVKGLIIPKRCPSGGFRTVGTIGFADGTSTTATSTVPCPHK
jgi:hypothetical protein